MRLDAQFATEPVESSGGRVCYTAYGYHGTEVLIGDSYRWQTYTNYTHGHAKMRLERIASDAWSTGIKATVYNCPEIRTNSSDVFAGLELSLLPLLRDLKKEGGGAWVDALWQECQNLLNEGVTLDDLLQIVSDYQNHEAMQRYYDFAGWPLPNSAEQAEQTIGTSGQIIKLHKDSRILVSDVLSLHVVAAIGTIIFRESGSPAGPVLWLNHDLVARQLVETAQTLDEAS